MNFSQLRLTGRRELCSREREERLKEERDAGVAEGPHSLLGVVVHLDHPLPHIPEVQAPDDYNSQMEAQLLRAGGGDRSLSILGYGVFALTVVSAG